jgi:hypothetical protein
LLPELWYPLKYQNPRKELMEKTGFQKPVNLNNGDKDEWQTGIVSTIHHKKTMPIKYWL